MNWKFTDGSNRVVSRINNDGSFESCLVSALPTDSVIDPADPVENPRIAEIKAELIALDIKRIRPLAEGDADYLATLNSQAIALRDELTVLTSTANTV